MRTLTLLAFLAATVLGHAGQAVADPAEACAKAGNDDTVRRYDPELRQEFTRAFKTLFPHAKGTISDRVLRSQGVSRCMDGKLYACFIGANLPCGKISVERDNPAVSRFCAAAGTTDVVPAYVTGHDTDFSYRCEGGKAIVAGELWTLDPRGFATKLWTPLD